MNFYINILFGISILFSPLAIYSFSEKKDSKNVGISQRNLKAAHRKKTGRANAKSAYKNIPWIDVTENTNISDIFLQQALHQNATDKLLSAIIHGDLAYIRSCNSSLRKTNKVNFYINEANNRVSELLWKGSYLALAVEKYKHSDNKHDKKISFKIIKRLVEKGANPNTLIERIIFQQDGNRWIDFPWSGPVAFEALSCNDNAALLKLLFDHGACANGKAPTYGDLLLYARKDKKAKFIKIIKTYLESQKSKGVCNIEDNEDEPSVLEWVNRKQIEDELDSE